MLTLDKGFDSGNFKFFIFGTFFSTSILVIGFKFRLNKFVSSPYIKSFQTKNDINLKLFVVGMVVLIYKLLSQIF